MARLLKIRVDASGIVKAAGAARRLGTTFGAVHSKLKGVTSGIFSLKSAFIGLIAIRAVSFFKGMIDAFGEQEKAERRLTTALKLQTGARVVSIDKLKEFAAAEQKLTGYGDEVILSMQAQMVALGGLSEQELPKATKATLDLAAATGIDLKAAALLMAKAAAGQTQSLSRYGLVLDEAIPQNEKFAALLKLIETNMGGMAREVGKTTAGAMMKMGSMWGDMKERIAQSVVESGAFAEMTKLVESTISDVVEYVKVNPRIFSSLFETGVAAGKSLITVTQALLPFFKYIVENKTVLLAVMGAFAGAKIGGAFGGIGAAIGAVGGAIAGGAYGASLSETPSPPPAATPEQNTVNNVVGNIVQRGEMLPRYFAWE